jgi:hypothetical protein
MEQENTNVQEQSSEVQQNVSGQPAEGTQPQAEATPNADGQQGQQEDLLTRINKTRDNADVKPPAEGDFDFNYNDIAKIEDPRAREQAEKAYKSFQRGFNTKFQEIADIRKTLEAKLHETDSWTPEKIQALMKNPDFVQAAQSAAGSYAPNQSGGAMNDEEWSALTDGEKQQFQLMQQQINAITQQNQQLYMKQQDEQLSGKYANYQPEIVDTLTNDLLQGKYQATREDVWKVHDYENAVRRAYELGKSDRQLDLSDKVQANSTDGMAVTERTELPQKQENESSRNYFIRLAKERVAQNRDGKLNVNQN